MSKEEQLDLPKVSRWRVAQSDAFLLDDYLSQIIKQDIGQILNNLDVHVLNDEIVDYPV